MRIAEKVRLIGLILFILLVSATALAQEYDVVYVVDGDTADVLVDGEKVRLRFLDINTPERGEDGYQEAKDFVKDMILDKCVRIETRGKGYYGRTLAYIFYDGIELNEQLYCLGYAERYRRSRREFNCK